MGHLRSQKGRQGVARVSFWRLDGRPSMGMEGIRTLQAAWPLRGLAAFHHRNAPGMWGYTLAVRTDIVRAYSRPYVTLLS